MPDERPYASGERFWTNNQPGSRFSRAAIGSERFFREVEAHRYGLEAHILDIVDVSRWLGADVLEAGCGIGTDGIQLARAGARYTAVDFSRGALELAPKRFQLEGARGSFCRSSVTHLPFPDASFDMVFSHGVIHHVDDTQAAVDEFHRVLRPGGTAIVMVYHRSSLNYYLTIMMLRRLLVAVLLVPGTVGVAARLTGENAAVLEGHRGQLRRHGMRYLTDSSLFLSNNTDGPGNPLSKVYSRRDVEKMFCRFKSMKTGVRNLNLRIYPGGELLARTSLARRVERRVGWHLYIEAVK
ncbi:MAG: class I SAM-dependent methyltransferase [Candidatus Dormibacteraeota bacterium]|nr:class I SAM-dependent methyltransferase [Candidatus Dormibacteraeota bacterium]